MLATSRSNGTSRARYWVQWVIEKDQGQLKIVRYCVRDMNKFDKNVVFEHEQESVCRKICEILNEGS